MSEPIVGYESRTEYILNGSQIIGETVSDTFNVSAGFTEQYRLVYIYDETGVPIGLKYRTPSYAAEEFDYYFFEKSLQGDIVAIYNESGTKIGTYTYDAWGNCTTSYTSGYNFILNYNPFRYRGYYYDTETGYYYLQSRYYNPVWGRFINTDNHDVLLATPDQLTDKNLFAYCDNNPIMRVDGDGEFWNILIGAVVGGLVSGVISAASQYLEDGTINLKSVGIAAIGGAVSGGFAASGVLVGGQMIANGIIGAVTSVADTYVSSDGKATLDEYIVNTLTGAGIGILGGKIGGNGTGNRHLSAALKNFFDIKKYTGHGLKSTIKNFMNAGKYYYRQIATQSIQCGKAAIDPIIISNIPNYLNSMFGAVYERFN